jgi:hypothetical protein
MAEEERASVVTSLLTIAESIGAAPEKVAWLGAECLARARAAAADLEQSGKPRFLPLLTELQQTLASVATPPAANACAAVAAATHLLAQGLKSGQPPPRARELIVIAELRGARGVPAPWRSPLVRYAAAAPEGTSGAAGDGSPARILPRLLAVYRSYLLAFLRSEAPEEARRLCELSRQVADACGEEGERRRWLAAAALFRCAMECGRTARPLLKRLAVELEQVLRHSSEGAAVKEPGGRALMADLEVLTVLLRNDSAAAAASREPALTLGMNTGELASALRRLEHGTEDPCGLLGQIADGFLVAGDYDRWLEARRLAASREHGRTLQAAVSGWRSFLPGNGPGAPVPGASGHAPEGGSILGGMELRPAPGAAPIRAEGIPVDCAVLENLDRTAREIRGARSRAEASLGSLKGGLARMDRAIRSLRLQLESLEVESQLAGGASEAVPGHEIAFRFGALSRGIEELAGLKNALQSLSDETEFELAAQAGEDARLEQELLKTRMAPLGDQFEALCQCVRRAAGRRGLAATLSARGAGVALERSRADALAGALEPLLEACVHQGLAADMAPEMDPARGRIELDFSQPRFDVQVDICYRGAPLAGATLAQSTPGLAALGAVVAGGRDGGGRARVRVVVPGPPQPMDLLRVEVGGNRYAFPLEAVHGVSRPPEPGAAQGSGGRLLKVEGRFYPLAALADVLKLKTAKASGSACVVLHLGGLRAFRVDGVLGRQRTLVSSPGPLLASNPWVLGVVVDGRAAPTLVLDVKAPEFDAASAAG